MCPMLTIPWIPWPLILFTICSERKKIACHKQICIELGHVTSFKYDQICLYALCLYPLVVRFPKFPCILLLSRTHYIYSLFPHPTSADNYSTKYFLVDFFLFLPLPRFHCLTFSGYSLFSQFPPIFSCSPLVFLFLLGQPFIRDASCLFL